MSFVAMPPVSSYVLQTSLAATHNTIISCI